MQLRHHQQILYPMATIHLLFEKQRKLFKRPKCCMWTPTRSPYRKLNNYYSKDKWKIKQCQEIYIEMTATTVLNKICQDISTMCNRSVVRLIDPIRFNWIWFGCLTFINPKWQFYWNEKPDRSHESIHFIFIFVPFISYIALWRMTEYKTVQSKINSCRRKHACKLSN